MKRTEQDERLAVLLQKLRRSGMRITPQRIEIIKTTLDLPTHPSAEMVFTRAPGAPDPQPGRGVCDLGHAGAHEDVAGIARGRRTTLWRA